jgi:GNAT superfamily N-acetyltransferase
MSAFRLRPMTAADRFEVAELIYVSINYWYQLRGMPAIFRGGPRVTEVFFDTYNALEPGCGVVAENTETGRLMGLCFYHPRPHHVSLGIMNAHPNWFGHGVARALLKYIIDFTDQGGHKALRLTASALNLDSYSLYTRAGFVPRYAYQDMVLSVPAKGLDQPPAGVDRVRPATAADVPGMAALEMEVSGITREQDYRYLIANDAGFWHTSVYENARGGIDGFLASSAHPAMNMLGPGVTRTEEEAAALLWAELNQHRGKSPVFLIPAEKDQLVRQMYERGARNCELHFCQVRGEFQPFRGVTMPTFLPETG